MSDNTAINKDDDKRRCLFGAGGHGRVVASQMQSDLELCLCFGDAAFSPGDSVDGISVNFYDVSAVTNHRLIITVGDNATRRRLQMAAERAGKSITSFVSKNAHYFAACPKAGTQVLAGAIVNVGVELGSGVIVNSGAIIEHDCVVGDYCHLAPGSVVCGGVNLGDNVLVGANATILPGISIASGSILGAGAVVTRSISQAGTYIGTPARLK